MKINDTSVKARLYYKRFKSVMKNIQSGYRFHLQRYSRRREGFFAEVPQQPPAGKLQYYFEITDSKGTQTYFKEEPVVIRFKGGVPAFILIPHILFMFLAMLFSTLAGFMAL